MATPQARKTAAATAPEAPELLSVLVAQNVLSADQAEKVRRAQKVNGFTAEQAVLQLGLVSDVQIAQAFAAHAGLPYVKINPLDLDLDVVTKAIAGPFARRHGMVAIGKAGNRITIAVHNPFAPFPFEDVKRVTGCEVDRVVATRKENADIALVRTKKANKMAVRRLKNAGKLMKENKKEEFYDEVLRALWGYLSDKLSIPQSDLTKDNVEIELAKYGVDESLTNEFMDILNTCEFARYAPSQASDAMDKLYELTVDAIGKMENTIKK